jgi:hypothetical protein
VDLGVALIQLTTGFRATILFFQDLPLWAVAVAGQTQAGLPVGPVVGRRQERLGQGPLVKDSLVVFLVLRARSSLVVAVAVLQKLGKMEPQDWVLTAVTARPRP